MACNTMNCTCHCIFFDSASCAICIINHSFVLQTSLHGEHSFRYSKVFRSSSSQNDIFMDVAQPMVQHCLDGYSACIFAYGQTGSGKTYTMFGEASQQGLIPR